jgi:pimeloyl-ACP methyl ester carboxylesterase
MSDMGDAVDVVLNHLKISELTLIGHSMGGYVALAYAEKHTEKVIGLCLMNSTYAADSEELKELRTRANEMVKDNFESMVRQSFVRLFSENSKETFNVEFKWALEVALKTSVQGYIAGQEGMKLRKDQTLFFVNGSFKKAILLGKKDAVLDSKAIAEFAENNKIWVTTFSEGHMSHIENKTECLNDIVHFIENI